MFAGHKVSGRVGKGAERGGIQAVCSRERRYGRGELKHFSCAKGDIAGRS